MPNSFPLPQETDSQAMNSAQNNLNASASNISLLPASLKTPTIGNGAARKDLSNPLYKTYNDLNKQKSDLQSKYDQAFSKFQSLGGEDLNDAYTTLNKGARDEAAGYRSQLDAINSQLSQEQNKTDVLEPFADIQSQQIKRAGDFKTAFPSILDNSMSMARHGLRQQIAEGTNKVRAGANQRGLLYSGLRAGAESDLASQASDQLNKQKVDINTKLTDEGNALDQDAINTGLLMGQLSQNLGNVNNTYRQSLIDQLMGQQSQRDQSLMSLLGAGGQLAGTIAGSALTPSVTPSSISSQDILAALAKNSASNFGNNIKFGG